MYLFTQLTGPQIKEVKPRVKVAELEVSQVEVAGLKVETADFYFEVSKLVETEHNQVTNVQIVAKK